MARPAAFGLEPLESRQLMAQISWDGGGGDNAWLNPLNWSGDTLPGPGDQVTIAAPGTPTIELSSGSVSIASLRSSDALRITGGSLSVSGDWAQSAPLELSGGALGGAGNLRLASDMRWAGGTIYGSGKLQVLPGATLTIDGDVTLAQRQLVNGGSVVWASGNISADGATITNLPEKTFLTQSSGSLLAAGAPSIFSNYGRLLRDGAADTATTIAITFNNYTPNPSFFPIWFASSGPWSPPLPPAPQPGVVEAHAGTLALTGTLAQRNNWGLSGGDWAVTSSTGRLLLPGGDISTVAGRVTLIGNGAAFPQIEQAVNIYGLALSGGRAFTFANLTTVPGTLTLAGSYTIPGTLTLRGIDLLSGDLTLPGDITLGSIRVDQGTTLTLSGHALFAFANISGLGTLRLTGNADWNAGTIDGPGQFIIAPGAALTLVPSPIVIFPIGLPNPPTKQLTRRIVNYGRIDWTASGDLLGISGELVNRGVINLNGGPFISTSDAPGNPGRALIQNFGTINTYSSLTLRGASGGVGLLNSGTVNIFGGRLILNGGGGTGGVWNIAQGAELAFGGLAASIQNAMIGGPGLLRIATTLNWLSTSVISPGQILITPAGRLIAAGGGSLISRPITNSGSIELTSGANLRIGGDVNSPGQIQLSTGRLQIDGVLTLSSSSTLGLTSASPLTRGTLVVRDGVVLDGRIAVNFTWPLPASAGTTVNFLTSGWLIGSASAIDASGLQPGLGVRFSFLNGAGTLTVVQA